ncbi:uncharacterized protein LOC131877221 [Tigriopus californicus]|uniref:uncharacterized protein LOC131877221 n=1 Tax=Tigriopus californicus TaxID=6832 RepID=UPI0027DA71C0|nr:uncharacterized protein LOC131877221 [Tigriopus californicus]
MADSQGTDATDSNFLRIEDPRSLEIDVPEESSFNYEETMYNADANTSGSKSTESNGGAERKVLVSTSTGALLKVNLGSTVNSADGKPSISTAKMSTAEFANHVCNQLKKKAQLLEQVSIDNQNNVSKAQSHIFRMQKAFQDRLAVLQDEISVLKERLSKEKTSSANKDVTIRHLKGAISSLPASRLTSPSTKSASAPVRKMDSGVDIIYPSKDDRLYKNGVFVLKYDDNADMCIKLPIKVSVDDNKMKIADSDIAGITKKQVDLRREVALQTIELLFNPLSATIKESRCQHLIWILLMSVFDKYHFKDPVDKYLLGPKDRITLNSELVIKTKREDLLETSKVWSRVHGDNPENIPENIKFREIEVMRHLKNIHKMTQLAKGNNIKSSRPTPSEVKSSRSKRKQGPDVSTSDIFEDATAQRELIEVACANSEGADLSSVDEAALPSIALKDVPNPVFREKPLILGFIPVRDVLGLPDSILTVPIILQEPSRYQLVGSSIVEIGKKASGNIENKKDILGAFPILDDRVKKLLSDGTHPVFNFRLKEDQAPTTKVEVKTEPKSETDQVNSAKVPEPFHCRYCERKFTSMKGWDAHLESSHSANLPFLCPVQGCHQCYRTKTSLMCHIKLCQKNIQVHENSDLPKEKIAPVVKRPASLEPVTHDHPDIEVKIEIITDPIEEELPSKRRRSKRVIHSPVDTPLISDIEAKAGSALKEQDEAETGVNGPKSKRKRQSSGKKEAEATTKSGKRTRKSTSTTNSDVETPSANSNSLEKDDGSTPSRPEYNNKSSRRQKHPQVSFTSSLKDFFVTIFAYMKTQKVLIKKSSGWSVNWNHGSLRKIEDKVDADKYQLHTVFMSDIQDFCSELKRSADGPNKELTEDFATKLSEYCIEEMAWRVDYLNALELQINPLLSGDPKVMFQHVLKKILEDHVLVLRSSANFQKPVDRKAFPDYYDIIQSPMCLNDIQGKINGGKYTCKNEFLEDFKLILSNSITYNGRTSEYTQTAKETVDVVKKALASYQKYLKD